MDSYLANFSEILSYVLQKSSSNLLWLALSDIFVVALQKHLMSRTIERTPFKVPITPKSFLRLNKSLHLFETHCALLPLFNPNIDLLQAVKVTKSGHHLSHDRASKGYGSIPCLTSQTTLHACLQRLKDVRAQKRPTHRFF